MIANAHLTWSKFRHLLGAESPGLRWTKLLFPALPSIVALHTTATHYCSLFAQYFDYYVAAHLPPIPRQCVAVNPCTMPLLAHCCRSLGVASATALPPTSRQQRTRCPHRHKLRDRHASVDEQWPFPPRSHRPVEPHLGPVREWPPRSNTTFKPNPSEGPQ